MNDTDWYGPDVATFGDRLSAAREQAGMTQEALAKRLGVRVTTVRKWEDDHAEPRANRLSMLAGLLNVSMMWLINGEGEGLDMPEADTSADVTSVLAEMRLLSAEMHKKAETMARLEKRLRHLLVAQQ